MIKRSFYLAILVLTVLSASAQRSYFLYFQTENQEPFFLKMGEKIYSSTASGYLILPKLRDTTHYFSIGFPGREAQDNFYITMNHKDHGYLLKHFADKGWGLFDLQTLGVQMASKLTAMPGEAVIRTEKKAPNEFTELLVKASNDTTLKERVILEEPVQEKKDTVVFQLVDSLVVKQAESNQTGKPEAVVETKPLADSQVNKAIEAIKVDTVRKEEIKEPVMEKKEVAVIEEKKEVPVIEEKKEVPVKEDPKVAEPVKVETVQSAVKTQEGPDYKPSRVVRRSESSTTGGFGIVFLDQFPEGNTDTIRILITPPKVIAPVENKSATEKKSDLKFLEIMPDTAKQVAVPQRCGVLATDDDFFQLRRDMAGEISDAAMMEKAKVAMAAKCYSITHIRNLGNLFLGEETKLAFYQQVYGFAADQDSYGKLVEEIKDPVLATRFRTWLESQSKKPAQ